MLDTIDKVVHPHRSVPEGYTKERTIQYTDLVFGFGHGMKTAFKKGMLNNCVSVELLPCNHKNDG
jgi:hypothetical protein